VLRAVAAVQANQVHRDLPASQVNPEAMVSQEAQDSLDPMRKPHHWLHHRTKTAKLARHRKTEHQDLQDPLDRLDNPASQDRQEAAHLEVLLQVQSAHLSAMPQPPPTTPTVCAESHRPLPDSRRPPWSVASNTKLDMVDRHQRPPSEELLQALEEPAWDHQDRPDPQDRPATPEAPASLEDQEPQEPSPKAHHRSDRQARQAQVDPQETMVLPASPEALDSPEARDPQEREGHQAHQETQELRVVLDSQEETAAKVLATTALCPARPQDTKQQQQRSIWPTQDKNHLCETKSSPIFEFDGYHQRVVYALVVVIIAELYSIQLPKIL